MKMKVSTRIILTIYLLVVILLCAFLLLTMYGVTPQDVLELSVMTILLGAVPYRILYTVIFAAMIVFGFMIMFFGIRKDKEKAATLTSFDNGKILVSRTAIEQLAKNYTGNFDKLKLEKIIVSMKNNMTDIVLNISVSNEVNIPEITDTLKNGLTEHIETHTGIKINNVRILVSAVSAENVRGAVK